MGKLLWVNDTVRDYRNIDVVPYLGLYLNERRNRELDRTLTNDQKLEKGVFRLYHLFAGLVTVPTVASWVNLAYQMFK